MGDAQTEPIPIGLHRCRRSRKRSRKSFSECEGSLPASPRTNTEIEQTKRRKLVSPAGRGAALVSRCAAEILPEKIEWLWRGRLARGKHTCIAGEPGTGKSQLSIAMIAIVTTGGEWPCAEGQAPLGSVIILSAEDGAADTIVPRLMAAGADLERVHVVSAVRHTDGSRRITQFTARS